MPDGENDKGDKVRPKEGQTGRQIDRQTLVHMQEQR